MKVHSKYLFATLFVFTGGVAIWMSALFFSKLVVYMQHCHYAKGKVAEWKVISTDATHYYVCVDYSFSIDSKTYLAQHVFFKPSYPNKEAAEYALEAIEKDVVEVWYRWPAKSPTPISMIDRAFPYNELVRFSAVLFILIYFVFLRLYLSHFYLNTQPS